MKFSKDDCLKVFYNEYDGAVILDDTTQYSNGDYPNHRRIVFEYEGIVYDFLYYSSEEKFNIKSEGYPVDN